jgi:ApaG protein
MSRRPPPPSMLQPDPAETEAAGEVWTAITRDIAVSVRTAFLEDHSDPQTDNYVWSYHITIDNRGTHTVRLLRRTWRITDARGQTRTVEGEGVVGEQPLLAGGQSFSYASGTPLPTPCGFMTGLYHMVVPGTGEEFDVVIPAFSLDSPYQPRLKH